MSLSKVNPANKPDRLYLSSDDAIDVPVPSPRDAGNDVYDSFTINLVQPVLGCDGLQVASFVQPNTPGDGPCIPDYQASGIGFLYYKTDDNTTEPTVSNLLQLYLLASTESVVQPPATIDNWVNRYYSSYQDFVDVLNNAAIALGAGPAGGPDVEFYYDATLRKIAFRGLDNTKYYMPAGYSDYAVIDFYNNTLIPNYKWPVVPWGYTLNQRVGFTNKRYNDVYQWKQGGTSAANFIYPYGYPNLVRTGSITLRTNFNYQSSINSKDNRDVLAVIPQSVPFLGVNEFQYNLNHYLTNIPETVQQMTIRMYDDQGQPYPVGNNVQTTIELLATFGGQMVVQ